MAPPAPPCPRDIRRDRLAGAEEIAGDVGGPKGRQDVGVGVRHAVLAADHAGVVDERGDATQLLVDLREQRAHVGVAAHVGPHGDHLSWRARQPRGKRLGLRLVREIREANAGAIGGQCGGNGRTDATTASGHDGDGRTHPWVARRPDATRARGWAAAVATRAPRVGCGGGTEPLRVAGHTSVRPLEKVFIESASTTGVHGAPGTNLRQFE